MDAKGFLSAQFALLQDEIAGRETGVQTRFLNDDDGLGGSRRDGERRKGMSDLQFQMMLAELRDDAIQALVDRETKTAEVLAALEALMTETQDLIDDMEANAARTASGEMVFKDKNGNVVDTNGASVSEAEAASVVWTGAEPSYEEYSAAHDKLGRLEAAHDEWSLYQTDTLGRIRDSVNDPDAQHTADDYGDMLDDMDASKPEMPVDLQINSGIQTAEATKGFAMPPIGMGAKS